MKHEFCKKTRSRIAALLMSAVLAAGVCTPVQAADAHVTIDGIYCYVTLSESYDRATASTISPLSAFHSAEALFFCYYVDDNLTIKHETFDKQSNNSASVTAVAICNGISIWDQDYASIHKIIYGATTWSPSFPFKNKHE